MKFCWTTVNVKDLKESLYFYEKIVGLKIDQRIDMGKDQAIVFLGDGETKLELLYNSENKNIDMGRSISLGFEVKSIEEKMEFVKREGIEIHSGTFNPAPNTKFFFILDPNGLKIQFVENSK
ncbi:MAG: VOC family protein [Tissierella sp.]|uniref:VOC family protein n=1 Tax=Tissierella sp. TaxID=41274 RepID=UPI003F9659AE